MKEIAIVIGENHYNTLNTIRSLYFSGIQCYLFICDSSSWVGKSKGVSKLYRCDTMCVLLDDLQECLKEISSFCSPRIIYCSDQKAEAVDSHFDQLSKYAFLPNCEKKAGGIARAMDKYFQRQCAEEAGLTTIPSMTISQKDLRLDQIEKFSFPLIIKPRISCKGTKNDITIVRSEIELKSAIEKASATELEVQQFVYKEAELQLFGYALERGDDEVFVVSQTEIIRSPNNTNSGYVKHHTPTVDGIILERVKKLIQILQYKGPFSVEFIVGPNATLYFLEINLRTDGNLFGAYVLGHNVPYYWITKRAPSVLDYSDTAQGVRTMAELNDLRLNIKKSPSRVFRWLFDLLFRTDATMLYNRFDPAPFWAYLKTRFLK